MKEVSEFESPRKEIIEYLMEEGYTLVSIGEIEVKECVGGKKVCVKFSGYKDIGK